MKKNAKEILAVLDKSTLDYQQIKQKKAREACRILEDILNSIQAQRELARHYQIVRNGHVDPGVYPSWAYTIAYHLYDPNGQYGETGKASLANLCRMLVEEFETEDKFFTQELSKNKDVPVYLAKAARELLTE